MMTTMTTDTLYPKFTDALEAAKQAEKDHDRPYYVSWWVPDDGWRISDVAPCGPVCTVLNSNGGWYTTDGARHG